MSRCHEFVLAREGLEHVRFLVVRAALSANGDIESDILTEAFELHRHPPGASISNVLEQVATRPDCEVVAMIRNPKLVLDEALPERVKAALLQLPEPGTWSLASAGGLGLEDERHLALYASAAPALPDQTGPQPILDPMPDITLIAADHAREVLAAHNASPDTALETILTVEGYLAGKVAVFTPRLTAGIDGDLMGRDLNKLRREIEAHFCARLVGQPVPTLTGSIEIGRECDAAPPPKKQKPLADRVQEVVSEHCAVRSISIVTRTRFNRPHLLRRLLTSISRARLQDVRLEVVLSSDAPRAECEAAMAALIPDFPHVALRLQHNAGEGPSRVLNLLEGIKAARMDYVVIIDDDDYLDVFAFEHLRPAFFLGNKPVIVTTSEVHEETWEQMDGPRPAIARSTRVKSYPARHWSEMFDGVNKLPVCALLAPRDFICRRIAQINLTHDLSEDYALFLALLTAPDLPAVRALGSTFCHISLRGEENSVGMRDRRPWVRDIAGHLDTLARNPDLAPAGLWNLLRDGARAQGEAVLSTQIGDLDKALEASAREIRILRKENAQLRAILSERLENAL